MTDLKNKLVEVWREEFESLFNEKYNQVYCGTTLKQWTAQNLMNQEFKFGLNYYIKARKKTQEEVDSLKTNLLSQCKISKELITEKEKLEQELQKTREQLEKCENSLMKVACFETHGENKYINHEQAYTGVANFARQYFQDKDKQGE